MKNKIGYIIIGMLLGSIITTSIFLNQIKNIKSNSNQSEMNEKMMPEPNSEMRERLEENFQGEPPEKPDEEIRNQNQILREESREKLTSENKI